MPARPLTLDDLPAVLPAVVLLLGDEDLLVTRAISALTAGARRADPDVVETQRVGAEVEGGELHELLGPSLFGDARILIVRAAQDLRPAALTVLRPYLESAAEDTTIVLHHAGTAKGKAVLEAARKGQPLEIGCAKLTRPDERSDFVRGEIRRAGGTAAPDAVAALVDAVGSDLRELAAVAAQLVSDSGGVVDVDLVRAYHRGRAEVTGFAVADLAVGGQAGGALETLRFALALGVPHVVIADAVADGVRSVARVYGVGRADPYALASQLGMPPWKVKKSISQARGWSELGLRQALGFVAELNAEVKGAAVDASYALERGVRRVAQARSVR